MCVCVCVHISLNHAPPVTGVATAFTGTPHANRVLALGILADGTAVSCGLDNR